MSLVYDWSIPIARTIDFQTIPYNSYDILSRHLQHYDFTLLSQLDTWIVEVLAGGVTSGLIGAKIYEMLKRWNATKDLRKELFPFLKYNSETVVGPRDPNTLKPSKENIEDALKVKIPDLFASCVLKSKTGEKIAGKIVKTLEVEDLRRGFQTNDQEKVIKCSNVNGIGGPVPLPLMGWIMYNSHVQFIYAPKIKPFYKNKTIEQLEESNLLELKKLEEEWYIERKDGRKFESGSKKLKPKGDRASRYEIDYCLIQKVPMSVLPGGGSKKHIYLFSGPHWEGCRGAVEALSEYKVLKSIEEKIEDEIRPTPISKNTFFEAVFGCTYDHKHNKIDKFSDPEVRIINI